MPKKIVGILGGSFDPIHNGHLLIAQAVYECIPCEKILLIPAALPPHKINSITTSAHHRIAMLLAACEDFPYFKVSDIELHRNGPSFTIDTLCELAKKEPDTSWHYIIGSDNLHELKSWFNFEEILKMVTLCVCARPGFSVAIPPYLNNASIKVIPCKKSPVSSTTIRMRLESGMPIDDLIPKKVLHYILTHSLYKTR